MLAPDNKTMRLAGRHAVVTGGTQGLGLAIARAFVAEGAKVLICGRDAEQLEKAATALGNVIAVTADVSREADVSMLVDRALSSFGSVDILVNNAGVYGPKGLVDEVDWKDWAEAVSINLFGSVLPCRALLPHMRTRRYGKIVQISGGGATKPMPRLSAYAASKAGVVRFTETLAEEVREFRIDVNALAPGALNTRMLDEILNAGPEKVGVEYYEQAVRQKADGGARVEDAAALCVFLASADSDGLTGKLISAVWDPWRTFNDHAEDLQSDIYTLRRILPRDRGFHWGEP